MSVSYFKQIGSVATQIGTTSWVDGKRRMYWDVRPNSLLDPEVHTRIFSENGKEFTVAEFLSEEVPWPEVPWHTSKSYPLKSI